ncbi:SusC/RagA family TonB-linked outer membrane protein [Proteiniphilum sp. UBA5384]|uniref:SusC/RagA family TonB-linked outer membrane protein n=1 Tax=Proteiniphilum sp. UBA5384 TaxID=1947279 RepID=UPI0025FDFE2F|nr:TonB-dependent receptor [Proteiniphilum sp. UBA5384]
MNLKNIYTKYLLLLFVVCMGGLLSVSAQDKITVNGNVVDESDLPLIGVTVTTESDATIGTVSDLDGNFTLTVSPGEVLVFSYVGFNSLKEPAKASMKIRMKENNVMLDAVTVVGIGYGLMRKTDLTGAISSVSAKDLKKGVVTSTEQLLQGKVAGLSVTQNSGDPAAGAAMRLRGGTSLSASNAPLVVVDGIPGVDINTVQPSNIISIDVLKDASAAAIYGSRGANGVIIVTTNRATDTEQKSIEYNGYLAVGTAASKIDLLSANQWRAYVRDNNITSAIDYGGNTDWIDELQKTAITHSHNLSMNSSKANSGYRASLTYQENGGIVKNTYMDRLAGSLSAYQYGLNNRLKLDMGVSATYDKYRQADTGFYGIYNYAINQNPTMPVKDEAGNYNQVSGTNTANPVEYNENYYSQQTRHRLLGYGKMELEVITDLKASVSGSYEYNSWQEGYYEPSYAFRQNDGGYGRRQQYDNKSFQLEAFLNYDKSFDENKHTINAMGGYSYLQYTGEGFGAQRRGFDTDAFIYNNLGAGSDYRISDVWSSKTAANLVSFFGRVNYNFMSRYMLTATLRADGSSRFGDNNKWGYFPSVSAAWRLSDEPFIAPHIPSWLNNLKLRLGYGVTGNQDGIGQYRSLAILGPSGGAYYDPATETWKNSYAPTQNPNPDLKWESTAQYNLGIDFSLFNRVNGTIELYHKKTSDLLWTYPVPQPPYLYGQMMANVGDLSNKGIELSVNANVMSLKDFSWDANLSFSYNKQKIESLSNEDFQDTGTPAGSLQGLSGVSNLNTQMVKAGYPTGAFFGPRCLGYDEDGNFVLANDGEYEYLGSAQPKFNLGLGMNFTYRHFDFGFSAYGMYGQKVLNATDMSLFVSNRLPALNVPDDYLSSGLKTANVVYSDYWVENGSFFRLQSATLGYTLPVGKNIGFEKIRFYMTGENLFVLTGYTGLDPEVNTDGLSNPGIDMLNFYPRPRTFSFGVNLIF